jgi:hypothetical protein
MTAQLRQQRYRAADTNGAQRHFQQPLETKDHWHIGRILIVTVRLTAFAKATTVKKPDTTYVMGYRMFNR